MKPLNDRLCAKYDNFMIVIGFVFNVQCSILLTDRLMFERSSVSNSIKTLVVWLLFNDAYSPVILSSRLLQSDQT